MTSTFSECCEVEYGHRPFGRLRFYKMRLMECLTVACVIGYAFINVPNSSAVRNDTAIKKNLFRRQKPKVLRRYKQYYILCYLVWQSRVQILCSQQQDSTFLSLLMATFCQDITQRQWRKTLSLTSSTFCRDTSFADGFPSAFLSPARTYDNLDACEVVQSASLITAATLLEVSGPAELLFPPF